VSDMVDFITSFALGVVRGILNKIIGRFTPQQLQESIETDFSLWEHLTPELRQKTMSLRGRWGKLFNKYYDMITTPLILEWQKKDHPSLYQVLITNPKGCAWLDKQVNRFKHEIKGC
jgi:hypothetical protein